MFAVHSPTHNYRLMETIHMGSSLYEIRFKDGLKKLFCARSSEDERENVTMTFELFSPSMSHYK